MNERAKQEAIILRNEVKELFKSLVCQTSENNFVDVKKIDRIVDGIISVAILETAIIQQEAMKATGGER